MNCIPMSHALQPWAIHFIPSAMTASPWAIHSMSHALHLHEPCAASKNHALYPMSHTLHPHEPCTVSPWTLHCIQWTLHCIQLTMHYIPMSHALHDWASPRRHGWASICRQGWASPCRHGWATPCRHGCGVPPRIPAPYESKPFCPSSCLPFFFAAQVCRLGAYILLVSINLDSKEYWQLSMPFAVASYGQRSVHSLSVQLHNRICTL